ncbi:MAG TPA: cytochrome P450, partial [Herpetosiphonaceae bacterium]
SWMWLLLMENPTIYERLQAEVHQATAQALPNINSLNQLGYVLQVFKEVLRLYPSAYIIARQTTRAITLGDFYVPAGTAVGISPYVVHRRACYYAQPNVFDPERFVLATEQQRNRYTYLPFGAGPHACIGAGFALMEAQLIIATLTTLFSFERADSGTVTPEPLITLRPNNPIMLRVHRKRHLVDCSAPESTLAQG